LISHWNQCNRIINIFKIFLSQYLVWNHEFFWQLWSSCNNFRRRLLSINDIIWFLTSMNQFYQHFTHAFFIQKCFAQLFPSYVLAKKSTFIQKRVRKMLMKLTPGHTLYSGRWWYWWPWLLQRGCGVLQEEAGAVRHLHRGPHQELAWPSIPGSSRGSPRFRTTHQGVQGFSGKISWRLCGQRWGEIRCSGVRISKFILFEV